MQTLFKIFAAAAVSTMLTIAFAQSAKDVSGASPYVEIKNEPAPKLIVDPPLSEGLAIGVFWAQYRVENLRIAPVFGPGALQVSPRIGHLHVTVDDLPWWWADPSNSNTVDIAGLPPGPHKVKIELVDANHELIPGQSKTVTFNIPESASHSLTRTEGYAALAENPERAKITRRGAVHSDRNRGTAPRLAGGLCARPVPNIH